MTNITETTSSRIHVGLDVHKDTVVVAVARRTLDSDDLVVEDRGDFKNRPASLKRWLAALTHEYDGTLHFVYEAGPCGFVMWRQLREWGHACEVVAPSLIPKKSGDRVKTDRRDARELAKLSLLGYLTPIWVPSETREAMRDLVRLRLDMKQMIQKQRQQLNHFLLRHGHAWSLTKWTERHRVWMKDRSFAEPAQQLTLMTSLASLADQERRLATLDHDLLTHAAAWEWSGLVDSLRALRGIDYLTAITVLAEIGDLRRFRNPAQFMAYLGLVPSEFSSGTRRRTGAITKTGNGVVRRILTESAWTYRFAARETRHLQHKAKDASDYARERSWAAQKRLCGRYRTLVQHGKNNKTVVTAIARELAGFIWDIACHDLNAASSATRR